MNKCIHISVAGVIVVETISIGRPFSKCGFSDADCVVPRYEEPYRQISDTGSGVILPYEPPDFRIR